MKCGSVTVPADRSSYYEPLRQGQELLLAALLVHTDNPAEASLDSFIGIFFVSGFEVIEVDPGDNRPASAMDRVPVKITGEAPGTCHAEMRKIDGS